MAGDPVKITDLSAFASTLADGDLVEMVDVSDTTDDAAGSSFKLTASVLAAAMLARNATAQTVATATDTLASGDLRRTTMTSYTGAKTWTVPTGTFVAGDWFVLQNTASSGDLALSTSGITINGTTPTTTATINQWIYIEFTASNTISVAVGGN